MADKRTSDKPFTITDPDGIPSADLKAMADLPIVRAKESVEAVYDPT